MDIGIGFGDRLVEAVLQRKTPVLVGLDPRWEQLPEVLTRSCDAADPAVKARTYCEFCRGVIDVVAGLVPAVKPQAAFFEQLGPVGMAALADVVGYAAEKGLLVIIDGKRSDIGSTAEAYADAYLGATSAWGGNELTVSPYLGEDSLMPFVDVARQRDAGIFVLVKTSNPGGGMFQDLMVEGRPVYLHVAALVEDQAAQTAGQSGYGAVGAVVGATYPEQLVDLRDLMPHSWLLVPGFGAQGGSATDVAGAFDGNGLGAIVNSSRGIIFAHSRPPYAEAFGDSRWQEAVEVATLDMIGQLADATPAGRL
ncbi:MAG: orotidine-5'-phosphate decarboxylase [Planctomycetales bacterium]